MTVPDPTVPAIPTPPKLTRLTTTRPVRVAFDYNVTPIYTPNPLFDKTAGTVEPNDKGEWAYYRSTEMQEYLLALGLAPAMIVYNGTENRSLIWHDGQKGFRDVAPAANRYNLDFSYEGNFSDPLDPAAARAVAAMAMEATHFGAKVNPLLPIFLDIEGSKACNGPCDTPEQAAEQIANWTARLSAYRTALRGMDCELYAYFMMGYAGRPALANRPDLQEADRAMMRLLTGYNAGLYAWDQTAQSAGSWFKQVDEADARVREYYPFLRTRWATINPCYQMLNGTRVSQPVPLEFWKTQLRYLADRGWNIFIWCGGTELKPAKGHLDAAAKYAMAGVN